MENGSIAWDAVIHMGDPVSVSWVQTGQVWSFRPFGEQTSKRSISQFSSQGGYKKKGMQ